MAVFMTNEELMSRADHLFSIGISGRYIPFKDLEHGFPSGSSTAAVAYAQSGDFVRFLYNEFGDAAVNDYLDRLARGEDGGDALEAAFGERLFKLENRWLKGVRRTYGLIPALSGGTLLWFLMSLLFIVAYVRKRARTKQKRLLMAMEEGSYPVEGEMGAETDEEEYYDEYDDDDDEPPFGGLH